MFEILAAAQNSTVLLKIYHEFWGPGSKRESDRNQAATEIPFVVGHSGTRQEDGTILVSFQPARQPGYRCVCLPKAGEPISITCCCGGHVRHHLQVTLGCELKLKVRSSALSSGGKRACSFVFTIE